MDKLLVISFYFPPFSRVGGRRWAKHLKYLHRDGHDFRVLAGDFKNSTSPWDDDIKEYSDKIHRIPIVKEAPFFQRRLPVSFFQKLRWKLSLWKYNLLKKVSRADVNDISMNYHKAFYKQAKTVIEEFKPDSVIVSVGPYYYAKILIKLKKKFPSIKMGVDYRDPWHDSYNKLGNRQMKYAAKVEFQLADSIDFLITVNTDLINQFKHKFPNLKHFLMQHAYDSEDIPESADANSGNEILIYYGGSLYSDTEKYLKTLIKLVDKVSLQQKIKLKFILPVKGMEQQLKHPFIEYTHNQLPAKAFLSKVKSSKYSLIIRPDWSSDAMSSKFFELIAIKNPILYFGKENKISEYIEHNNLGRHVHNNNIEEIADLMIKESISIDKDFNITEHSFRAENKLLLKMLESL